MKDVPTRTRLLHAAKTLFQQRGYHGVGVSDILAKAQAPKGSLYHHFPDGKDEIAAEAVRLIAADVSGLIARWRTEGQKTRDILIEIGTLCEAWFERSNFEQGPLIAVLAQSAGPETPRLCNAVQAAYQDWCEGFAETLREEGARDPELLAELSVAVLEGALALKRSRAGKISLSAIFTKAASLLHAA